MEGKRAFMSSLRLADKCYQKAAAYVGVSKIIDWEYRSYMCVVCVCVCVCVCLLSGSELNENSFVT